jgi:hypothetical protein
MAFQTTGADVKQEMKLHPRVEAKRFKIYTLSFEQRNVSAMLLPCALHDSGNKNDKLTICRLIKSDNLSSSKIFPFY